MKSNPLLCHESYAYENHRSRERIKTMGEVFTPENYIDQMLDLLDTNVWSDETLIFFEPTCGHGNIVIQILKRRFTNLAKKYKNSNTEQSELRALANALNTLWALDICRMNVEATRNRLLSYSLEVLGNIPEFNLKSAKSKKYLAHIMCTIHWQIRENETLSALSTLESAFKTKIGIDWVKNNEHQPIEFNQSWNNYYNSSIKKKIIPVHFREALNIVDDMMASGGSENCSKFSFARGLSISSKGTSIPANGRREMNSKRAS